MFDGEFAILVFRYTDEKLQVYSTDSAIANKKLVYYAFYKITISEENFSQDIQDVENWRLLTYVRSPRNYHPDDKAVAKNGILILATSDPRKVAKNVSFYMFKYDNIITSAHKPIGHHGLFEENFHILLIFFRSRSFAPISATGAVGPAQSVVLVN
jgi:hypothetical protein